MNRGDPETDPAARIKNPCQIEIAPLPQSPVPGWIGGGAMLLPIKQLGILNVSRCETLFPERDKVAPEFDFLRIHRG
jgi:hypothetical protein